MTRHATIDRKALASAAARLQRVTAGARGAAPALHCARIFFGGRKVGLTATDPDIRLNLVLDAETGGAGGAMIPARTLTGFARGATGPVTLTEDPGAVLRAVLILDDGEATLRLGEVVQMEDFPAWPERGLLAKWEMSADAARRLLSLGRHCISTDETRVHLNGTLLTVKPGGRTLRAVSSDGRRMAVIDSDVEVPEAFPGGILPARAVAVALDILPRGGNAPVMFRAREGEMDISMPGARLRAQMIDGGLPFPDYTRVIPSEMGDARVTLTAAACRRMAQLASAAGLRRESGVVEAHFDPIAGRMTVMNHNGAAAAMPATFHTPEGAPTAQAWGMNLKLLTELGRVAPIFTLQTGRTSRDALIARGEDPDAFWAIMPMWLGI
ncbi:MAG: DNA polymerase III subunit beta [Paracoccaceae bacterium]|nr:DNA polymerase III subunit beta [Paracoccaceae bacterium]